MTVLSAVQLLGTPRSRFFLVDYYSVPWEAVPAGTPPPVVIATRELSTGKEAIFAAHLQAEAQGIPPAEIPSRFMDLERLLLQEFVRHVRANAKVWWVHWGLNRIDFGFPALVQRGRAVGLADLQFPEHRMINLSHLLVRVYGDAYVPHPRLRHLIALNGLNEFGMRTVEELTQAYHCGAYAVMVRSLLRKLSCLARIVELLIAGNLRIGTGEWVGLPSPSGGGSATWRSCARAVLEAGRCSSEAPEPMHTPPTSAIPAMPVKQERTSDEGPSVARVSVDEPGLVQSRNVTKPVGPSSELPLASSPCISDPVSILGQYVTLDQMAAVVNRSKRTLERLKNLPHSPLPMPDVEGGGGRPDEWLWTKVRPVLEAEYGRPLPDRFPGNRENY